MKVIPEKAADPTLSLTPGSIPFVGADGKLAEDNENLVWDDDLKMLHLKGDTLEIGTVLVEDDGGCLRTSEFHAHGKGGISGYLKMHHGTTPSAHKEAGHSILWSDAGKLYFEKEDGTDIEIPLAGSNLWQRIGTELSPLTPGDDVVITGEIKKSGVIVPNRNEIYNYTTGWLTGGVISINSGDNTKIDITAGSAVIVDYTDQANPTFTRLTWDEQIALDPALATRSTWIGVVDNGSGGAQFIFDIEFDATERRSTAILGRIWNSAGTQPIITSVGSYERPNWGLLTAFQDFILEYGSWNINGNVYSANGANLLLDKSSGRTFRYHAEDVVGQENVHNDAAQIPRSNYAYHLQGSSTTTSESDIEPDYYDNNGVKTALANNKWSIQEVWYFPVSGTCHVLYGQAIYNSKTEALDSLTTETKVRNTDILSGAILRAYLVLEKGCTNLTNTSTAEIREAGIGAGGSGGGTVWTKTGTNLSPTIAGDDLLLNTGETLSLVDMTEGSIPFVGSGGLITQDNSNLFWDNTNNRFGAGSQNPKSPLHIKGNTPGTVGDYPAGQLIIQNPSILETGNAAITGYTSDINGDPVHQLWYFGSSSSGNRDVIILNRANANLHFGTDGSSKMVITPDGDVGIGTTTVPHGGIGLAMLAINSSSSGSEGSHVQYTNSTDDYPLFTQLNWAHDDVSLAFDSYYDLGWKSSDVGSNFVLRKNGDKFSIEFDSGIPQGSGVIWNTGFELDTAGDITTLSNMDVGGSIRSGSNGSSAIPAISWTDDNDTGFYRIAENSFAVTAGNAEILRFTNAEIYASKRFKMASGAVIFSGSDLIFGSGNSTAVKMSLKSDGTLELLGDMTVPTSFDINDGTTDRIRLGTANSRIYGPDGSEFISITDTAIWMYTTDYVLPGGTSGTVGLGNGSWLWQDVWAVNGTIQTSDRRDKKNIAELDYGLDAIKQLKPVTYEWKESKEDKTRIGLIAQEVLDIIPEAVQGSEKEHYGINYGELVPVLIKAIQEQQKQIDELRLAS